MASPNPAARPHTPSRPYDYTTSSNSSNPYCSSTNNSNSSRQKVQEEDATTATATAATTAHNHQDKDDSSVIFLFQQAAHQNAQGIVCLQQGDCGRAFHSFVASLGTLYQLRQFAHQQEEQRQRERQQRAQRLLQREQEQVLFTTHAHAHHHHHHMHLRPHSGKRTAVAEPPLYCTTPPSSAPSSRSASPASSSLHMSSSSSTTTAAQDSHDHHHSSHSQDHPQENATMHATATSTTTITATDDAKPKEQCNCKAVPLPYLEDDAFFIYNHAIVFAQRPRLVGHRNHHRTVPQHTTTTTNNNTEEEDEDQDQLELLDTIAFCEAVAQFNLALAYHQRGKHMGEDKVLLGALQLYEQALVTLQGIVAQPGASPHVHQDVRALRLCLANNRIHILHTLARYELAQSLVNDFLLASVRVLTEDALRFLTKTDIDHFLLNALVIRRFNTAPCA